MSDHTTTDWYGLYSEGWTGEIVPDAMVHPAKYSRALIRHIYDHLLLDGLVAPGDTVVDPFGGVALGALDAMRCGLSWVGCELEDKFVQLGRRNIDHWTGRYAPHFPVWGRAALLQGDSRQLTQVLTAGASGAVTSPPWGQGAEGGLRAEKFADPAAFAAEMSAHDGNRRAHPASPDARRAQMERDQARTYGDTPANLGNLRPTDTDYAAVISSPPYAGNDKHDFTKEARDHKLQGQGSCFRGTYSRSEGQLGDMPTGDFAAAVSSPPFSAPGEQPTASQSRALQDYDEFNQGARTKLAANMQSAGNLAAMQPGDYSAAISSPPYNLPISQDHNGSRNGRRGTTPSENGAFVRYGNTPGQLEGLPQGDFDAAVASPPYEQSWHGRNHIDGSRLTDHPTGHSSQAYADGYGSTPGQIGGLPGGDFDAAVSSPPYAETRIVDNDTQSGDISTIPERIAPYGAGSIQRTLDSVVTFWTAAGEVVEQTYLLLRPGACAVWVVKDYVRNGERVPFADQWRRLCESRGFTTLHVHRAWLVEQRGAQLTLDGEIHARTVERKSFFRRLAERRGSPRIDWETVLCMRKPEVRP